VYKDKADEINAKAAKEFEEAGGDGAADGADGDGDDGEKGAEELGLPLARVKRIMKLDKEVKNMQVDASKCVAKCAELFIESLVEGSFRSMRANKRKTIKYGDVEHHVLRKQRLEFLHDHVWAFRPEEMSAGGTKGGRSGGGKENDGDDDDVDGDDDTTPAKASPEAPPGARQVTDFFKKAAAADGVPAGA
jgi:histone H3/H4